MKKKSTKYLYLVHICTHAVALSLFALCIERTLATLFYRSYASVGSRVAKVIVPFQVRFSDYVRIVELSF